MRIIAVSLLMAGLSSGAFAEEWSKNWSVAGSPEFHADVADGRIEMRAGGGGQISARVTTEGWKINENEVRIVEHQNGDRVDFEIHVPKTNWSIGRRNIRVEVTVPSNTAVDAHTGDGSVQIVDVRGPIHATSGDGSIEITGADGRLQARSGDGHIRVRGRFDNLDLETGDGSIEADLLEGSRLSSGWRVHTGDGSVTVRVPSSLQADVDAHTGDGSVTVDLPLSMDSVGKSRSTVRGKVNGGGELLTISTGDGSIHIEKI